MSNFIPLHSLRKGELLLLATVILLDLVLSLADLRRFVDILFIEGMAAIIIGSFLVALSMKPSVTIPPAKGDSELTNIIPETQIRYKALGTRIVIVGIVLLLSAVLIGEVWVRRLALPRGIT